MWFRIGIIALFLVGAVCVYAQEPAFRKKKVWIDTDNKFGKFNRDVDDHLAIISCLNSDSFEIVGIGLARAGDYGRKVTQKLLKHYAPYQNIPVYRGAINSRDTQNTEASQALTALLERDKITLLVLGPATNIATALRDKPQLAGQIEELIFCGGRTKNAVFKPSKKSFALRDANFDYDTSSFLQLLRLPIPLVLAGYEASTTLVLTRQDIRNLRKNSAPYQRMMHRKLNRWAFFWKKVLKFDGFMPFDAATAAYLTHRQSCNCVENIPVRVSWKKNDTVKGYTKGEQKLYLEISPTFDDKRQVSFCYPINAAIFKPFLMEKIRDITHK